MKRSEITKFLSRLLEKSRFSGPGKYWAREVTPLDGDTEKWKLSVALNCHAGSRKRSMTELLFCMVRSWN